MCIQEPYVLSNGKDGYLPKGGASYCSKTTATLISRGVIVVVNMKFPMVELVATRDVIAAKPDLSRRQVVVTLVYLPPEDSVDSRMGLLQ